MNGEGTYTHSMNILEIIFKAWTELLAVVLCKCKRCPTKSSTMALNGSSLEEALMSVMEEDDVGKISTIVSWVVVSLFGLLNLGVIASLIIKRRSKSYSRSILLGLISIDVPKIQNIKEGFLVLL